MESRKTNASRRTLAVLGIETSCDETAAAIVTRGGDGEGAILSNIVRSQLAEHQAFGGVVPEIAARAHVEVLDGIIAAALREAGLDFGALDGVAVTLGPGLIGGLLVGTVTARAIAAVHDLPLLAINHLEGHALTVGLTENLQPPYLLLLVSGGHTQLIIVRGVGRYQRLGATVDDALGEAFDKTAKLLGLGFPGGPEVERWAQSGDARRFTFPRPMAGRSELHFSFSGLKTAVRHAAQKLTPLGKQDISDICASFEEAATGAVCDRVEKAMAVYLEREGQEAAKRLVAAGGVAANRRLQAGLRQAAQAHGFSLHIPPPPLCTDNAAMIAWAGAERLARGLIERFDTMARARWPLDETAPRLAGAGVKA